MKKRRTAKQRAATRKMIAANKRRGRKRGKRRSNPIAARWTKAKRRAAGKKAARTRARKKSVRRAAGRKGARKRSGSQRRKGSRVFKRSASGQANRRRAAARRRKAGYEGPYAPDASETKATRRRRKRRNPIATTTKVTRRRRRRNPIAATPKVTRRRRKRRNPIAAPKVTRRRRRRNPISTVKATRRRRKRRNPIATPVARRRSSFRRKNGRFKKTHGSRKRHYVKSHKRKGGHRVRRHMRNPLFVSHAIANPLQGPAEFLAGAAGVGFGFALASLMDRLVTTHALNSAGQDAPVAGQIYNSEALDAPMWAGSNYLGVKRLAAALGSALIPLGLASATKRPALKSFFQLAGFAAFGRTVGKLTDDAIAHLGATNVTAQRLYGGEIAAAAKLTGAATTALPTAAPATFAGVPAVRQIRPANVNTSLPPAPPAPHRALAGHTAGNPNAVLGENPVPASTSVHLGGKAPYTNPLELNPDNVVG